MNLELELVGRENNGENGVGGISVILSASSRLWTRPENRPWRHRGRVTFHVAMV